jgi:hypothetical protein
MAGSAAAHGPTPLTEATRSTMAGQATTQALLLDTAPVPMAARYAVSVTLPRPGGGRPATPQRHQWYFFRDAEHIALLKGNIDEAWHRDAAGRLSFERVFHEEHRAVDYSAGELATLGVQADWRALSSFIDGRELTTLKLLSRTGRGKDERIRLAGTQAGQSLSVDWLPALQLPARVVRESQDGRSTRIELEQHGMPAPAGWPVPGARASGYLRLDAADFGDMDYEPVVKQSEALDVRSGWRSAHAHD